MARPFINSHFLICTSSHLRICTFPHRSPNNSYRSPFLSGDSPHNLKLWWDKEYQTDVGPADYVLFADEKPARLTEIKRPQATSS